MKVTIDRSGCIGCGLCADTCPEVFRMSDDGKAEAYARPEETAKRRLRKPPKAARFP